MGLLEDAQATLRSWRNESLAVTVQYHRPGTSQANNTCLATMGESRVEELEDGGAVVNSRRVDWLIDRSHLSDFGEPIRGDVITSPDGILFEVCDVPGERCFRIHGRDYLTYRIHSKQVPPEIEVEMAITADSTLITADSSFLVSDEVTI